MGKLFYGTKYSNLILTIYTQVLFLTKSFNLLTNWSIDETLKGTSTPCENGLGFKDNEDVFHAPQRSTNGYSPMGVDIKVMDYNWSNAYN